LSFPAASFSLPPPSKGGVDSLDWKQTNVSELEENRKSTTHLISHNKLLLAIVLSPEVSAGARQRSRQQLTMC
jgi:hypothetical protein